MTDYLADEFLSRTEECRQDMGLRCYDSEPYGRAIAELADQFVNDKEGLLVENLSVSQKENTLYEIEKLCLAPGQVVGLVGANGSGKTSLARYLVGLAEDKKSRISWQGQTLSSRQRLEKQPLLCRMFDSNYLRKVLSENLLLEGKIELSMNIWWLVLVYRICWRDIRSVYRVVNNSA